MTKPLSKKSLIFIVILVTCFLLLPLLWHGKMAKSDQRLASDTNQKELIQTLLPTAQALGETYGIRPSVLIGQALVNSQNGQALLALRYHNYYHVPAQEGQAFVRLKEPVYLNNHWTYRQQAFRVYTDQAASMADYLQVLRLGQVWDKKLYEAMATASSYKSATKALEVYQYTSDPEYASKVNQVIESQNLTQYDQ